MDTFFLSDSWTCPPSPVEAFSLPGFIDSDEHTRIRPEDFPASTVHCGGSGTGCRHKIPYDKIRKQLQRKKQTENRIKNRL